MSTIDVLQRLISFLLSRTPFAAVVASLSTSPDVPSPIIVSPVVAKFTIPHITISHVNDLEDFPFINLIPSDRFLSPSSCRINPPHPRTAQPAVNITDTPTAPEQDSVVPSVVVDVPDITTPSLSASFSCTDLAQVLNSHLAASPCVLSDTFVVDEEDTEEVLFSDESAAGSDEEIDDTWEVSSGDGSDAISVYSAASDDMDSHSADDECDFYEDDQEVPDGIVAFFPPTPIASAVPRRVFRQLQEEQAIKYTAPPLQVEPQSVDNIDDFDNYKVEWLTPRALQDAKTRSRKIQRVARMRALALSKAVSLGLYEHPQPTGRRAPSVLKDLGRSSRLRQTYNLKDLEEEAERDAALLQRFWDEEVF